MGSTVLSYEGQVVGHKGKRKSEELEAGCIGKQLRARAQDGT